MEKNQTRKWDLGKIWAGKWDLYPQPSFKTIFKWNEDLKKDSVTNLKDSPSDVDRSDCNLSLVWS